MKQIYRCLGCILFSPLDFLRLTADAWSFTIEGFTYRFIYKKKDQPCIYCRGMDCGFSPRVMRTRIRYWNLWMVRILHPNLAALEPRRGIRKVPMCRREGGYVHTPAYTPLIAITCSLIWLALIWWVLYLIGLIPPEIQANIYGMTGKHLMQSFI